MCGEKVTIKKYFKQNEKELCFRMTGATGRKKKKREGDNIDQRFGQRRRRLGRGSERIKKKWGHTAYRVRRERDQRKGSGLRSKRWKAVGLQTKST